MDTPMQKMQRKYDHLLDRMWDLFQYGRNREDLLTDELHRIKALCATNRGQKDNTREMDAVLAEIEGICDRGLAS